MQRGDEIWFSDKDGHIGYYDDGTFINSFINSLNNWVDKKLVMLLIDNPGKR